MRAPVFIYIYIEEVAHTHVQNAPIEWFSSTPRPEVMQKLSEVEQDQLVAYPMIDIRGSKSLGNCWLGDIIHLK